MFSRRKYLRRKRLALLMLNAEVKSEYHCLELWCLSQSRPYWFREADLKASQSLLEIVPETLIFHECFSIISLSIPACLLKCSGNKPQMEMWDFSLQNFIKSRWQFFLLSRCDILQSSRECLGVQALRKMPWSLGQVPQKDWNKIFYKYWLGSLAK